MHAETINAHRGRKSTLSLAIVRTQGVNPAEVLTRPRSLHMS